MNKFERLLPATTISFMISRYNKYILVAYVFLTVEIDSTEEKEREHEYKDWKSVEESMNTKFEKQRQHTFRTPPQKEAVTFKLRIANIAQESKITSSSWLKELLKETLSSFAI